jgi:BON domain
MSFTIPPWQYPGERYYYGWYGAPPDEVMTDGDIKAMVVDRLNQNPFTKDEDFKVDVKRDVVILTGVVHSTLAKRAAVMTPGTRRASSMSATS